MSASLQQSLSTQERLTGQVKWFNTKSGYGFITVCDGEVAGKDIFVHYSSLNVANSQYRYLVQGEYVDFVLIKSENDKYEYHATEVGGVKGGLIMCETRRVAAESQLPRQETASRPTRSFHDNETMETKVERIVETKGVDSGANFETVAKKRRPKTTKTL